MLSVLRACLLRRVRRRRRVPRRRLAAADAKLAEIRLAVIREFDAAPGAGPLLGPYFGFVGPPTDARDPRFARPYVTALEQLADYSISRDH